MSPEYQQPNPSEAIFSRIPIPFFLQLRQISRDIVPDQYQKNPMQYISAHNLALESAAPHIVIAIETLRKNNTIPDHIIFDMSKMMFPNASESHVELMFQSSGHKGILHGLRVGVIGGAEGYAFAALGARAANIDPKLAGVRHLPMQGVNSIPCRLEESSASSIGPQFDLTFSKRVIDVGSGVATQIDSKTHQSHTDTFPYKKLLVHMLSITKPGGLSVHDGNMMHEIVPQLMKESSIPFEVLSETPQYRNTHAFSGSNIYVLRRLK